MFEVLIKCRNEFDFAGRLAHEHGMLVERVLTEISIISFVLTKRVCSMNMHEHRVAVPGNDINIRYVCLVRPGLEGPFIAG